MSTKLLEVDTKAIKFICEVKKQSTSSVHLTNVSDEYVAFKVKTTSPKRFCVRPNSGVISPKSACEFSVTMQGLRTPASEVECKDKFLIQGAVVDAGTKEEDFPADLFSKSSGKYVEDKKLRVILVDAVAEEHKHENQEDPPVEEHKHKHKKEEDPSVEEQKHKHKKQEDPPIEEHKHKHKKEEDPPVEEHKHKHKKQEDPPVEEDKHKKQDPSVEEQKHKRQEDPQVEEQKDIKQDLPVEEHKQKKQEDPPVEEHKLKKQEDLPVAEQKHKRQEDLPVEDHNHKKQDPTVEEYKDKKQDPPVEEQKHKKQDPPVEENKKQDPPVEEYKKQDPPVDEHKKKDPPVEEHKNKVLEKEPSNETKLVKKDEHVSPKHMRTEDVKEAKSVLPKEDPKPSGDLDVKERNVSNNLKFSPAKVVNEDPQKKLRLRNQLKDLKLKESTLENQLIEAKSTISTLTYQNSKIIEAKEILQMELERRSKKGFSFASVCMASLIGVIAGYFSDL